MDVFEMGAVDVFEMGEETHMCFMDMLALMCGTPPLAPSTSYQIPLENVPHLPALNAMEKLEIVKMPTKKVRVSKVSKTPKTKRIKVEERPIVDGCNCEHREPQLLSTGELNSVSSKRVHHLILDLPCTQRARNTPETLEWMIHTNWHVCHLKVKFDSDYLWSDTTILPSVLKNLRGLQTLDITQLKLDRVGHGIALQAQFLAGEHSKTLHTLCMDTKKKLCKN